MKPATAPAKDPPAELNELATERLATKNKLRTAQSELDSLLIEQATTAEKIAAGTTKPQAAEVVARKIEQAQATVSGCESLLRKNNARIAELTPIVQRSQADAARAVRLAEVAELKKQGTAAADKVNRALEQLISVLLPELDRVRDALKAYLDVGGPTEAAHLIRMIVLPDDELAVERRFRTAGWKRRYDLQLNLRNLHHPPKR